MPGPPIISDCLSDQVRVHFFITHQVATCLGHTSKGRRPRPQVRNSGNDVLRKCAKRDPAKARSSAPSASHTFANGKLKIPTIIGSISSLIRRYGALARVDTDNDTQIASPSKTANGAKKIAKPTLRPNANGTPKIAHGRMQSDWSITSHIAIKQTRSVK